MTDEQKEIFLLKLKLDICRIALTEIRNRDPDHYADISAMSKADFEIARSALEVVDAV